MIMYHLNDHVSYVIFMYRIKFYTVSDAFWSKFYKPSSSYQTRLPNLNYINNTQRLGICQHII